MRILQPENIEQRSFDIIKSELDREKFSKIPEEMQDIIVRVIHSTADFDFLNIIRFSEDFFLRAITALRNKAFILTDIKMVKYGISRFYTDKFNIKVDSFIDNEEVIKFAKTNKISRSMAAMRLFGKMADNGLIVIGNAPTALFEVVSLIEKGEISPAAIIGVPVGFVGAAESKDELIKFNKIPYITSTGRKGGTPVAVAIVNALLRKI